MTAVVLPRTRLCGFPSAQGGYQVMIGWPATTAPESGFPALFFLDGNALFGTARDSVELQSIRAEVSGIEPGIVVAVGYPGDAAIDVRRRTFDFTEPMATDVLPPHPAGRRWPSTGGAEAFRETLGAIVRLVQRSFPVDQQRCALFGHSLAGRFAVRAALEGSGPFRSIVAVSPSLWFGGMPSVPEPSPGAADRGPARRLHLFAGGREELGPVADPARAERQSRNRIVTNSRSLSDAIAAASLPDLVADFVLLPDEDHASILPAAVTRAVRLAFRSTEPNRSSNA